MFFDYEIIIGLEVHVELQTQSKMFCCCPNRFGERPNTNVCPVCLGLPGSLPVFNERALELGARAAMALNCQVASYSKFDRKNYFYPDLPKAYQISQHDFPLARDGFLDLMKDGQVIRRVNVERLHLEEDAGKLLHDNEEACSYVDFNRCGVPLMEIVTAPDMRSPQEAQMFLETLKKILLYTAVSDCKMEEGSLRCDANISLRQHGELRLGKKVEIKNMNSFRSVFKGLEYEKNRQAAILQSKGLIFQETRRWDEGRGKTFEMRGKEQEHDYRYFPEPDLTPLVIEESMLDRIKSQLPELPVQRAQRFTKELELTPYQAEVLTSSQGLANFFEETLKYFPDPQITCNWLLGEILRLLNEAKKEIEEISFMPHELAELLDVLKKGDISGRTAKEVLEESFKYGSNPRQIIQEKGLVQISDEGELLKAISSVIHKNPSAVNDYKEGNTKALTFLVGMVMKQTKGRANPKLVTKLLRQELAKEE